jgi:outer membrane biosynthesis protein TonB
MFYTALVCGLFLILAIFYTWPMQVPPVATFQDLIDVNLGNESEGFGDVQPLVPGDPAPDNQSTQSAVAAVQPHESPSQSIAADESNDETAAPVVKSEKPKEPSKVLNKETAVKPTKSINPSPIVNPNPAPPKPKVPTYKGGTGTGGNGADQDNGYRNQGYKPGGTGDAGSPDGKPDAYGNSPGGRSGISVSRGLSGRRPISFPSMTDNFNENAIVFVDIKVDASGKVTAASISKGTTTSNSTLRNIAIEKAKQLKFPASDNSFENGTIKFNFVLKS